MNGNVICYNEYEDNQLTFGTFCRRYLIEDPISFYTYIQNDFYSVINGKRYLQFRGSDLTSIEYDPELVFFENDLSQLDLARKAAKRNDGLGLKNVRCWQIIS